MINPPVSGATNMSGFSVGYRRTVLLNRFYDVDNGKQVETSKPLSISSPVGSVPQGKLRLYEPEYVFKNDSYLRANYNFVETDKNSTFYNMFSATTDGTNITATVPSDIDTSQPIYLRSYLKKKNTVTYNANGGTGSMTATKTGETVAENTFTRSGYQFTGWNTRARRHRTERESGRHRIVHRKHHTVCPVAGRFAYGHVRHERRQCHRLADRGERQDRFPTERHP